MSESRGIRTTIQTTTSPVLLHLKRFRGRPNAAMIGRLVLTAVVAYELAVWSLGTSRPLLAPLTALLVLQATLYQTLRHAWQRLVAVVAGVLVAVLLSSEVRFTWWSLGLTITAALICGFVLRLGNYLLEVPISAMLILSFDTRAAAIERITETIIGAATGLAAGLVASPIQIKHAEEAIEDLSRTMADILDDIAETVEHDPEQPPFDTWLVRARLLDDEIHQVGNALQEAEESIRLNPRAIGMIDTIIALRESLETLEHCAINIRGLARSLADHATQNDTEDARTHDDYLTDTTTRTLLAETMRHLAAAIRTYGRLIRQQISTGSNDLDDALSQHLTTAHRDHIELSHRLHTDAAHWPLHGELLVHLDRIRTELRPRRGIRQHRPRTRRGNRRVQARRRRFTAPTSTHRRVTWSSTRPRTRGVRS
ncbi:FUSC family protein [Actinomadura nitritigenes]|uniref:FUSC family protein n=1 Tax=Actinomadura nitritigenes TaxID=134602 RepID=A0ABS3RCA4_9ACTN|nr:FUSC family protein [Actinomadura nitritigenes]MBO2443862.1 FUSC family protein [Actinomadura nitritigenes]